MPSEDRDKNENTMRLDVNLMIKMTSIFLAAKLKKQTEIVIQLTNQLLRSTHTDKVTLLYSLSLMMSFGYGV